MHAIHTTPGFIIGSRAYGEAGKILSIFTRDFGLVRAVAQGIRLEKSKLRYHVQDLTLGEYSLVRGKEYWRLTNAESQILDRSGFSACLALLLRRFLQGEGMNTRVFDVIESCILFYKNNPKMADEKIKTLESVAVFRILEGLGYIGNDPLLGRDIISCDISGEFLDRLMKKRTVINKHINKALKESHL